MRFAAIIGITITLASNAALAAEKSRPNIVFILTDDQRFDALGCAGNDILQTPNLDALARRGVRFENAFVTLSICSPSRAACLTGQYNSRNGVTRVGSQRLSARSPRLPLLLRGAGYRTAVFGKWHLGDKPDELGFDEFEYFTGNGPYYNRRIRTGETTKTVEGFIADDAQPRRIYLALDDHTDYMWTADEDTFRDVFVRTLDYYLDLADKTADQPTALQSRFNCDGAVWLWAYEQQKTPEELSRLVERIRSGHINVPLNTLIACYGGMPTEAVLRSMYPAGILQRKYDLRFPVALALENQTMPYGLASLWAGSGAKYTWSGICSCATRLPPARDRRYPLYWWVGPDGQRILTKWYPLLGNNQSIGGYAEARRPAEAIRIAERHPLFQKRHPYSVLGIFGKGWDDLQTLTDEFPQVARRMTTPDRQVIVSNQVDFFQDVERTYGNRLPELSCSFGNEWELFNASLAEPTRRIRRAVERLRTAEAMSAMVSLATPEFWSERYEHRQTAHLRLAKYYEHCFGARGPLSLGIRERWHRELSEQIAAYADDLYGTAAERLGQLIGGRGGTTRFFVFNPLGWRRTDVVDLPLRDDRPAEAVDLATGRIAPSQVGKNDRGQAVLRILASDVPPVGYRVFEVRRGPASTLGDAAVVNGRTIENDMYRLTVSPRGAITSLVDKTRANREFAATIDGWAMNELSGSETPHADRTPSSPAGSDPSTAGPALEVVERGPVRVTVRTISSSPILHETRITLHRKSPRISVRNEIRENFVDVRHWKFSCAIEQPVMRHEELGAILTARLVPDGGHYSPYNARYDHLTLNHFADISGRDMGITLSNADCSFVRLGRSTVQRLDTSTPQLSVLAGGRVDGPGFLNQGGDDRFLHRFALRTHGAFDAYDAMRFALEDQNPLVAGAVTPGGSYHPQTASLIGALPRPLVLWAVKPAEEGIQRGLIVRVWNLSDRDGEYRFALTAPVVEAHLASHVETDVASTRVVDGEIAFRLDPWRMQTWRLRTSGTSVGRSARPSHHPYQ